MAIWIVDEILDELKVQKRNKPFPDHVAAQAGIITAAAGRVMAEALDRKYDKTARPDEVFRSRLKNELVRTAASALRMIENL